MTHPLLANTETWLAAPYVDERVKPLLRLLNAEIIERHGARLFSDRSLFMSSPECSVRGHTIMAKIKPLGCSAQASLLDDLNEWKVRQLADEIALEHEYFGFDFLKRLGDEGHGRLAFCPYVLVTCPGISVNPATFEPMVPFGYMAGYVPLDQPCPPCDVAKDADLTKWGLSPLK